MKELTDENIIDKFVWSIISCRHNTTDKLKADLLARLKRGREAEELVENLRSNDHFCECIECQKFLAEYEKVKK